VTSPAVRGGSVLSQFATRDSGRDRRAPAADSTDKHTARRRAAANMESGPRIGGSDRGIADHSRRADSPRWDLVVGGKIEEVEEALDGIGPEAEEMSPVIRSRGGSSHNDALLPPLEPGAIHKRWM
jgi:hypothetical protein